MSDKTLEELLKEIEPNFNSHIEKGTIEMSIEYYNLLEERMIRLLNENKQLKEDILQLNEDYLNELEENYKLTELWLKSQQENKQLKERYERLKQEHIDTITRNEEKQQRIDKAIEYIKNKDNWFQEIGKSIEPYIKQQDILKILGDKE